MRAGGLKAASLFGYSLPTGSRPVRLFRSGKTGETIWAEVKGISGRELMASGAEVAEATIPRLGAFPP